MNLADIQQELRNQKLDGWLFFDHHLRDPLAYRILGLTPGKGPSRRWYYMIPAEGEPKGMEHRIERNQLAGLPGEKIAYSSWTEQVAALGRLTAGMKRVAMAYSPMCAVPYVAIVDAGTVELVRSLGVDVVTAAELIQIFEARWTRDSLETHLEAGRRVDKVRAAAFELIRQRTRNRAPLQEVEVKDFVRQGFADAGLVTDSGPIVGCNANASNPHYEPSAEVTSPIKSGDWVLLDAPRVHHGSRRARRGHRPRAERHIAGRDAARLRGGRRLPGGDRSGRLRGVLYTSHGPLHRRRSPRQRREYG
jgi:Xaa-Pro aminopeptidase